MSQCEFALEDPIQEEKAENTLPAWEKIISAYAQELENPESAAHQALEAWKAMPGNANRAFEASKALFLALHRCLSPQTAFVINSSTGKDSTVVTHVAIAAIRDEIESGRGWNRPVAVAIADTGSEFPEMAARMQAEAIALNKLGVAWGIPLEAVVVKPPVRHRLLVELCGNGKPVPAVSDTGKQQGVSAWCMDRVKAGSLRAVNRLMIQRHGSYVPLLGVRSAESTKRRLTINQYKGELPIGLSRISGRGKKMTLASIPICLWENREVSDWIRAFAPPWRPQGREEIRAIYYKGSPLEDSEDYQPSECSMSISEEGTVSNSCSDLSGTRYGCWHCFQSCNKSLKNTSRRDSKYIWPRKFHAYIYGKDKAAIKRAEMLKKKGFTKENSFTKTFTFLERYKILMMLYRCELESGLVFLLPEEEAEIQTLWEKHGIFCVTPKDARLDAIIWKKTGRWKAFYEDIADEAHRLCNALSEGIPFGATFGLKETPEDPSLDEEEIETRRGLELIHLLAFTGQGYGAPPYPKQFAYVFEDRNPDYPKDKPRKIITALTDSPTLLGLPTNTGLLNGMCAATWHALGIRQLLPWEKEIAQDRNFVYEVDPNSDINKGTLRSCPTYQRMEWVYQLQLLQNNGCKSDDPMKDHWFDIQLIQSIRPLTSEEFKAIFVLSEELCILSDQLTDHFSSARAACLKAIHPFYPLFLERTKEGKNAQARVRKDVKTLLRIQEAMPMLKDYARLMKLAAQGIAKNMLNTSLILKLCYIHQMLAVDPQEGAKELNNLLCHLKIEDKIS